MTAVTRQEIERIAHLARLEIDARSMAALTAQIEQILQYVSQLEAVDTTVGDLAPPWLEARTIPPLRGDDVSPADLARNLDEMAPAFRDGFFLVPRLEGLDEE